MTELVPEPGAGAVERIDRFNARDMTPTEVAHRFVAPSAFDALRTGSNTLVIGPRGSGKTTLLKMLTPEGIEVWNQRLRRVHDDHFSGVYIPIDIQLADQLEGISAAGLPDDVTETTVVSVYALHVFRCVAESLAWHCGSATRRSSLNVLGSDQEGDVISRLAELWNMAVAVPRVAELQEALRHRQVRLLEAWSRVALEFRHSGTLKVDALDFVEFDAALKGAMEVLSRRLGWPAAERWAVMFDEVEVAPVALQRRVLSYLRHSDEHMFFKLAIAPYMQGYRGLAERSRGSALNDYSVVDLVSRDDDTIRQFSHAFFAQAAVNRGLPVLDMEDALGPSLLTPRNVRSAAAYGVSSEQAKRFISLARKDLSFAAYLESNALEVSDLIAGRESDDRAPLRKARQVVIVREAYLTDSAARRVKSRTDARRLFTGAETIVRMCEGNPRRLAFLMPGVLAHVSSRGRVPPGYQVIAVERTEVAFRSFLRGLPVSEELGRLLPRGVLSFVDLMGSVFHDEIVKTDFDDDPIGSFIVDSNPSGLIEEVIARGVNAGALVQLSDSDFRGELRSGNAVEPMATSRGKRFRLSHLLAPTYGLVLRRCRALSLTTLLKRAAETRTGVDKQVANGLLNGQGGLF